MRRLVLVLSSLLVLSSCATTETYQPAGERLAERESVNSQDLGQNFTSGGRGGEGITGVEKRAGDGSFINEEAAQRRSSIVSDQGEIVLNFEGEAIQLSLIHI